MFPLTDYDLLRGVRGADTVERHREVLAAHVARRARGARRERRRSERARLAQRVQSRHADVGAAPVRATTLGSRA